METLFTGKIIHHKDEVNSTNIWADKEIKRSKVLEGTVFRANHQLQGKGQRGRVWNSEKGANLLVSYVFHPHFLRADQQFGLVKCVSLAIKDVLDEYLIDKSKIKWPNDIYVNDMKIAGILIESTMKGSYVGSSVVGIGLNVNQNNFEKGIKATSMISETGRGIDLDRLLAQISFHLEKRYLSLRANNLAMDAEYQKAMYRLNEPCNYEIDGHVNLMINKGVDTIGQVILEDEIGRKNAYGLHQIKMII